MNVVILENIRSAYNVGNIVRTADALGWKVWFTGYTPSPLDHPKVKKTSLGAEETVDVKQFGFTAEAIDYARSQGMQVLAAEIAEGAVALGDFDHTKNSSLALIFGNEVEGVLDDTLKLVDQVIYIPMLGVKESLNVGQSAAILMWELGKKN